MTGFVMAETKKQEFTSWMTELMESLRLGETHLDVLLVTNQENLPEQLCYELGNKGFEWEKVCVDDFITHCFEPELVGTILLDTSEVINDQREMVCNTVRRMEYGNTATILLNNDIDFPLNNFDLVTILESVSVDEIIGRIENNIKYHKNGVAVIAPGVADGLSSDITEQLKMAGQVQRDFLPKHLHNSDKLQWAAHFKPADWVSGDIYDAQRLDEEHVGFYIADAVGHSMPAALLTMFIKQAIVMRETYDNSYEIFEPSDVVAKLNERMCDQGLSGCSFATVCYCLLNIKTLEMRFARGGHPYPVLVRDGKLTQLQGTGGLIGVFTESEFDQQTIQLQKGDKLFLYSDGGEDVVGSCSQKEVFEFNYEFTGLSDLSISKMIEKYASLAERRILSHEEIDDVTALGLEIL